MNRFVSSFLAVGLVSLLQGCGGDPGKHPDPVEVTGKVLGTKGAPITGVKILFQPTSNMPTSFGQVGAGGAFTAKAVPGEYIYYFEPRQARDEDDQEAAAASWAAIPAKYREPQKDNTVKLSTTPVEIKLAP